MALHRWCALVVVTAAVLAGCPAPARAQEKIGDWTVIYDIRDLSVLKIEKNPDHPVFSITVQNVSGRPITRVAMHLGGGSTLHFGWLQPGATRTVGPVNQPKPGEDWAIRVSAVLFGDGAAAADGDPADIEYMRFVRLGEVLEYSRCMSILSAMDPAHLGPGPISTAMSSVDQPVWPLATALASLPDSALKKKMIGASAGAANAFLGGVQMGRADCRGYLEELMKQPSDRARFLSDLLADRQADLKGYKAVCDLDMGTAR